MRKERPVTGAFDAYRAERGHISRRTPPVPRRSTPVQARRPALGRGVRGRIGGVRRRVSAPSVAASTPPAATSFIKRIGSSRSALTRSASRSTAVFRASVAMTAATAKAMTAHSKGVRPSHLASTTTAVIAAIWTLPLDSQNSTYQSPRPAQAKRRIQRPEKVSGSFTPDLLRQRLRIPGFIQPPFHP